MQEDKEVESVRLDLVNTGQSNLYETRYKLIQINDMCELR